MAHLVIQRFVIVAVHMTRATRLTPPIGISPLSPTIILAVYYLLSRLSIKIYVVVESILFVFQIDNYKTYIYVR